MSKVIPAILTADRTVLKQQLEQVRAWTDWVHIDVCDGQFVPNQTLPLEELLAVPSELHREFHLMVKNPQPEVAKISAAGNGLAIIHIETLTDPAWINQSPNGLGLAINPKTSIDRLTSGVVGFAEIVVMGVEPGFQGRDFDEATVERVARLRPVFPEAIITVDGGVNRSNLKALKAAGANQFVVGSAIWRSTDPAAAYRELVALATD